MIERVHENKILCDFRPQDLFETTCEPCQSTIKAKILYKEEWDYEWDTGCIGIGDYRLMGWV